MAENIVFLEVLKNLDKLSQDTFFMSYSPLPIYGWILAQSELMLLKVLQNSHVNQWKMYLT